MKEALKKSQEVSVEKPLKGITEETSEGIPKGMQDKFPKESLNET